MDEAFAQGAGKGRLLLVDDDRDIRQLLAFALRRDGYRLREAGDGAECLRVARAVRPELIILNYLMPIMDGLTALRELKKDPSISHLKVLMFSAVGRFDGLAAAAFEAGAVGCLRMPFDPHTFLRAVRTALRSR